MDMQIKKIKEGRITCVVVNPTKDEPIKQVRAWSVHSARDEQDGIFIETDFVVSAEIFFSIKSGVGRASVAVSEESAEAFLKKAGELLDAAKEDSEAGKMSSEGRIRAVRLMCESAMGKEDEDCLTLIFNHSTVAVEMYVEYWLHTIFLSYEDAARYVDDSLYGLKRRIKERLRKE